MVFSEKTQADGFLLVENPIVNKFITEKGLGSEFSLDIRFFI